MSNYFSDYKKERTHDYKLINVVYALANENKTDVFRKYFIGTNTPDLGKFIEGRVKRDFDVFFEFENFNIIIESKVDSVEGKGKEHWQTENIYNVYSERWKTENNIFLYVTYGQSEFYIKKRQNGEFESGAYSTNFKHIKCENILSFLKEAHKVLNNPTPELITWIKWLEFEINKRCNHKKYLEHLSNILELYKKELGLTDYPVSRINLFTPEFTIPFYYSLSTEWNKRDNKTIGKVCLYAVGRGYSPVFDSIINFSELWNDREPLTCNGLFDDSYLYFEFNEDFNLHLKADDNIKNIEEVKEFISKNTNSLTLENKYLGVQENYKQGSYVLFEWELKILSQPINITLDKIEEVLLNAINILK